MTFWSDHRHACSFMVVVVKSGLKGEESDDEVIKEKSSAGWRHLIRSLVYSLRSRVNVGALFPSRTVCGATHYMSMVPQLTPMWN